MLKFNKMWTVAPLCISILLLGAGCQSKDDNKEPNAHQAETTDIEIPLIRSEVVQITLPKQKQCLEDGCTTYDYQTVETNESWINNYFHNRIQKANPVAFENIPNQPVKLPSGMPIDGENIIYVRYLGQNYNLASFQLFNYAYSAGAAHGMYNTEYIIFDLGNKKRITVSDLIKDNAIKTVEDRLYLYNESWLKEHNIERDKLKLSDNFYYGQQGIVFVYPLYELAAYVEGETELVLPYNQAQDVIKAEYLPSEPILPVNKDQ